LSRAFAFFQAGLPAFIFYIELTHCGARIIEMTKADLVEKVAREADMTKKDAEQLVEIIFDSIIETLNNGEKIELRGFGSFRVRERNSRRGRNPKTGAAVDIPANRVAYFKPGKDLKELINTNGQ
jgi:integration host factor subunit beta